LYGTRLPGQTGPWPATDVDADRDGVGEAALALTLTVGGAPEAERAGERLGLDVEERVTLGLTLRLGVAD